MATAILNIQNPNSSIQVGDELYYSCVNDLTTGGYTTTQGEPSFLGIVVKVKSIGIEFEYDPFGGLFIPCDNIFISFRKSCAVNTNGIKGYFAEATFVNNDFSNKNELFAVSSQASYSSK